MNFNRSNTGETRSDLRFTQSTNSLQSDVQLSRGGSINHARRTFDDVFGQQQASMQRPVSNIDRDGFAQMEQQRQAPSRIHFFKFDQRMVTFYNVDQDKKTRELLNIDFNIPMRFCSI